MSQYAHQYKESAVDQPTNVTPNFLTLGYYQLQLLMDGQFQTLSTATQTVEGGLDAAAVEMLIRPILNPTGIWADYNPTLRYYARILDLVDRGLFPPGMVPPPPLVQNYQNLSAERGPITACSNLE